MLKALKLNLILLLIFFLSILAIWQVKRRSNFEVSPENKVEVEFLKVNKEDVQEVKLEDKEHFVRLRREEGKWLVSSPGEADEKEADVEKVSSLLDKLSNLKEVELVSTSGEKLDSFGLGAEEALRIEVIVQGEEREFLVGRDDFSRGGSYVKWPEEEKVYLSADILGFILRQREWVKKEESKNQ